MARNQEVAKAGPVSSRQGQKQARLARASSSTKTQETEGTSDSRQKRKRKGPELFELAGNKNIRVQEDSEVSTNYRWDCY